MPPRRRATKSPLTRFIETADALIDIYRRRVRYRGYEYGPDDAILKTLDLRDLEEGVDLRLKIVERATAAAQQLGPYGHEPRAVLVFAVAAENPETSGDACQQWAALKVDLLAAQIRLCESERALGDASPLIVGPSSVAGAGAANLNSSSQVDLDLTGYLGPYEKKAIADAMGLTIPKLNSFAERTPGLLRQVACNRQQWHVWEDGLSPSARTKLQAPIVTRRRRVRKSGDNSR